MPEAPLATEHLKPELKLEGYSSSVASTEHPEVNQDSFICDRESRTFAVFDGLGGHSDGELASKLAQEYIHDCLKKLPADYSVEDQSAILEDIFLETSENIKKTHPSSATTASVLRIIPTAESLTALICNIGDSRVYLFRDDALSQISQDDSKVSVFYFKPDELSNINRTLDEVKDYDDLGNLNPSLKRLFIDRNIMTQSLGNKSQIHPHIYTIPLMPGDKILLSTDGIHDNLTFSEIAEIMKAESSKAPTSLIDMAVTRSVEETPRSKPDDMTAVVVQI